MGKSDHSVLEFKLICMSIEDVSTTEKYNYIEVDYIGLTKSLYDWNEVFKDCKNEQNILWEKFMDTYNQSVKSCIPIKKIRKGSRKKYPNEITVLIKKNTIYCKDILKQKMI